VTTPTPPATRARRPTPKLRRFSAAVAVALCALVTVGVSAAFAGDTLLGGQTLSAGQSLRTRR